MVPVIMFCRSPKFLSIAIGIQEDCVRYLPIRFMREILLRYGHVQCTVKLLVYDVYLHKILMILYWAEQPKYMHGIV